MSEEIWLSGIHGMHGRKGIKTFSWKNLKKDYLEDLGIDYCVIIKCT